jgi:hypothetical protein
MATINAIGKQTIDKRGKFKASVVAIEKTAVVCPEGKE